MTRTLLLSLCLALAAGGSSAAPDFVLASRGRAKAVVVARGGDTNGVGYAANMLAEFLGRLAGAKFMVADKPVPGYRTVLVGAPYTAKAPEETCVRVKDANTLEVTGDGPIGTAYAVLDLLETLGCEFVAHDFDSVPSVPELKLPGDYAKVDAPFMNDGRGAWQWGTWKGPFDWALKLRLDTSMYRDENGNLNRGGVRDLITVAAGHTADHAINQGPFLKAEKYAEAHPEWYALDRKLNTRNHQWVCVSQEGMFEAIFKEIEDHLRKHPETRDVSIAEGDCACRCGCDRCRELERRYPDPDGTIVDNVQIVYFCNRVSKHFEKSHPNVRFNTLAYGGRFPAHPEMRFHDNVGACAAELWRNHGLPADCNERSWTCLGRVGTQSGRSRPCIWDYLANFSDWMEPFPNAKIFAQTARYYKRMGVRGVSCQLEFAYAGDLAEMKTWLYAKLLWNPDLDIDRLIDRYCAAAFGSGAGRVREYIDIMEHARLRQRHTWYGCYLNDTSQYLTGKDCVRILDALDGAVWETQGDRPRNLLARRARIAGLLLALWRYSDMIESAREMGYELRPFAKIYADYKATMYDSSNDFNDHWTSENGVGIEDACDAMLTNSIAPSVLKPALGVPVRVVSAAEMTGGRKMTKETDCDGTLYAQLKVSLTSGRDDGIWMNPGYAEIGYTVKPEEVGEWYVFVTYRIGATVPLDIAAAYAGIYEKWYANGMKPLGDKIMECANGHIPCRMSENGEWRTFCLGKRRLYPDSRVWVMPGVLHEVTNIDVKSFTLVSPETVERGLE